MGTETFHLHYKRIIYRLIPVKLNNPLMGTETDLITSFNGNSNVKELN